MKDHARIGVARYRKWYHAHRAQFWYGNLTTTVAELKEPLTGNGTTRMESSFGTGPSEGPYRKWHSPAPEMVQNESRPVPVPVMADCQFGDRTKWKISRSGIQKRIVLEGCHYWKWECHFQYLLVNCVAGYLYDDQVIVYDTKK